MAMKILVLGLLGGIALAQLPNPKLTPGGVRDRNRERVCSTPTDSVRHVSDKTLRKVCQRYKTSNCPQRDVMEIDHLVPLELGGSNNVKNLWVELAEYPTGPGFHVKDRLENRLHHLVCHLRQMSLKEAQECIRKDWIACQQRIEGKP